MEESSRKRNWSGLLRWVLWWRIDPEELRRESEGYATIECFGTARGFGCLLAIMAGVAAMLTGAFPLWHDRYWFKIGNELAAVAEGLLFVVLGCYMHRGRTRAITGAMLLWTINLIYLGHLANDYFHRLSEYGLWLTVSVLGWTTLMHVYFVALKTEYSRSEMNGPAAIGAGESSPC